jgi:hypothetical protein
MCGPKFCSMKTHTHLADSSHPAVIERAPEQLVQESLAFAREAALARSGSVAQPQPVLLGKKPAAA